MFNRKKNISPEIQRIVRSIKAEPENWYQGQHTLYYTLQDKGEHDITTKLRIWTSNGKGFCKIYAPYCVLTKDEQNLLWDTVQAHMNTGYYHKLKKVLDSLKIFYYLDNEGKQWENLKA